MAQKGGADVSELFNTSLWTGTGAARTITTGIDSGEGSLVWIKSRSGVTYDHQLYDTVRGGSSVLSSNTTDAEITASGISTFSGSGYTLTTRPQVNGDTYPFVGWQFRRAEKFFDIVQYSGNNVFGRKIAHNLGVKPGLVIIKLVNFADNWSVYQRTQGALKSAYLNTTGAFSANNLWADTEPDDSTITVGSAVSVNSSGGNYIAYLFAHDPSPEGFIQCGSFTENTSVNLGWKPQYILFKSATNTSNWYVKDSQRGANALFPNTSGTEGGFAQVSFTPTGFDTGSVGFGGSWIYMAIREAA